jgi:hypothetical protein
MRHHRLLAGLLPVGLLLLTAAGATAQAPVTAPTLAGTWVLDTARSDDAEKKLDEALNARRAATPPPPGRGRSTTSTVGGAGAAGGQGAANVGRGPRTALFDVATLLIELTEARVIYTIGDQSPLLLEPGLPVTIGRWGMPGVEVRTELRNDRLTIDSRSGNLRVQERYELKRNGEIEANITMNIPGVNQQVRVKRIYTAAPQG